VSVPPDLFRLSGAAGPPGRTHAESPMRFMVIVKASKADGANPE
jgi:hypothetical protein